MSSIDSSTLSSMSEADDHVRCRAMGGICWALFGDGTKYIENVFELEWHK